MAGNSGGRRSAPPRASGQRITEQVRVDEIDAGRERAPAVRADQVRNPTSAVAKPAGLRGGYQAVLGSGQRGHSRVGVEMHQRTLGELAS